MDQLELIAASGVASSASIAIDRGGAAEQKTENLARVVDVYRDIDARFDDAAGEIRGNRALSDEGRKIALDADAAKYLAEIDQQDDHIDAARKLVDKLRASMATHNRQKDDAAGAVREGEVRAFLLTQDEGERLSALQTAVDTGDSLTFAAFANAPAVMRLLPAPVIEDARAQWLAKSNPEAARSVRLLESAIRSAESVRDAVANHIRSSAGVANDPVSVAAGVA